MKKLSYELRSGGNMKHQCGAGHEVVFSDNHKALCDLGAGGI